MLIKWEKLVEKLLPRFGQRHIARSAVEQAQVQPRFQIFYAVAQRRRRNPQKLPCLHKTLRLRQRQKIIQFVKVLHFLFKLSFISEFNSLYNKAKPYLSQ